jgi:hypothetical protein
LTAFRLVVVEPVFRQTAELEVLDQDIGVPRQVQHARAPFLGAEIRGDGFLAPVAAVEIGGGGVALPLHEGRTPAAGVVALGRLDLDDLRPRSASV